MHNLLYQVSVSSWDHGQWPDKLDLIKCKQRGGSIVIDYVTVRKLTFSGVSVYI